VLCMTYYTIAQHRHAHYCTQHSIPCSVCATYCLFYAVTTHHYITISHTIHFQHRYAARVLKEPEARRTNDHDTMFFVDVEFITDGTMSNFPMHHSSKVDQRDGNAAHLSWQIVDALPNTAEDSIEESAVPKRRSMGKK
jgi:hypothetical protein